MRVPRNGFAVIAADVGWVEPLAKPINFTNTSDGYRFARPILRTSTWAVMGASPGAFSAWFESRRASRGLVFETRGIAALTMRVRDARRSRAAHHEDPGPHSRVTAS